MPIKAAAESAGLDIDEAITDAWRYRTLPFVERPKGFALDQRLTSGDVVVLSMFDLLTVNGDGISDQESIEGAIDLLAEWQRRGVRVIVVELAERPETDLAEFVRMMAPVQAAWRLERRTAPAEKALGPTNLRQAI